MDGSAWISVVGILATGATAVFTTWFTNRAALAREQQARMDARNLEAAKRDHERDERRFEARLQATKRLVEGIREANRREAEFADANGFSPRPSDQLVELPDLWALVVEVELLGPPALATAAHTAVERRAAALQPGEPDPFTTLIETAQACFGGSRNQ